MGLFEKLTSAKGVTMLCGVTLLEARDGSACRFAFETAATGRKVKLSDYVLLALHYQSQILARYPRSDSKLDAYGMDLRWRAGRIIEEGLWNDSDLLKYAGYGGQAKMVKARAELGSAETRTFSVALVRSLGGDALDAALDIPADAGHEELSVSVFALMQGVLGLMDDGSVLVMDRAFRYLKSYWDEGAEYGDIAAARNMANRALRDAGADAA